MTGINDYTNYQSGSSQVYAPSSTSDTTSAPPSTTVDKRSESTISRSQQEAVMALLLASCPTLSQPDLALLTAASKDGVGSVTAMSVQAQMDKIALDVVDAWGKNLEEIKKQREAELKSPQYQAWLERQSPETKAREAMLSPAAIEGVQGAVKSYMDANANSPAAIGLMSLMAAGSGQSDSSVSPFQKMWQLMGVGYNDKFSAQLGIVGGLFSSALEQFSTAERVSVAFTNTSRPVKDSEVAQDYANSVINLVSSSEFHDFLKNHVIARVK